MNVDEQRRAAGEAAAALVRDGMALGYGTGRAAAAALEALARRKLRIRGVPTSERTAALCRTLGLPLTTLEETPELDLCLDGADEIDPRCNVVKGHGGALFREKIVALNAERFIVVAVVMRRGRHLTCHARRVPLARHSATACRSRCRPLTARSRGGRGGRGRARKPPPSGRGRPAAAALV